MFAKRRINKFLNKENIVSKRLTIFQINPLQILYSAARDLQ